MFLLVSVRHVGAHADGHQHGVSIQISKIWVKNFFRYLVYEILLWSESWRGSLHIYLHSISQILDFIYWTVLILFFCFFVFLFLTILNGVTLKTINTGSTVSRITNIKKISNKKGRLNDTLTYSLRQKELGHFDQTLLFCSPCALLVPLKVVYCGSVTKPCTPALRGRGDTKVSQQFWLRL